MNYHKKCLVVIVLYVFTASTGRANDFSLRGLRFFFTPSERNPEVIPAPKSIEAHQPAARIKTAPKKSSKPIRYVGTIRSQNKHRLFWKLGDERYLSTVPEMQNKRQSNGSAKSKTTIPQGQQ